MISTTQLREAGLSADAVLGRVRAGRLHRVHRGVYAVGHRSLTLEGRWMAAVLACGPGAVLSHRSAAQLWGLLDRRSGLAPIDVSVASQAGRAERSGIHLHRRPTLTDSMITRERAIPVTNPAKTIADLKGTVLAAEYRRAIRQAEVLGLRTGIGEGSDRTRSELEHLFIRLCERSGLPRPRINVRVGLREVDFLWPEHRLIVETDGYRYHRGSAAFEDDHERDLELRSQGYDVLRFTYKQVTDHPKDVARVLKKELANR